jgi:hypothetical protein
MLDLAVDRRLLSQNPAACDLDQFLFDLGSIWCITFAPVSEALKALVYVTADTICLGKIPWPSTERPTELSSLPDPGRIDHCVTTPVRLFSDYRKIIKLSDHLEERLARPLLLPYMYIY